MDAELVELRARIGAMIGRIYNICDAETLVKFCDLAQIERVLCLPIEEATLIIRAIRSETYSVAQAIADGFNVHGQRAGYAETRLKEVIPTAGRQEVTEIDIVPELAKVYDLVAEFALPVFCREIPHIYLSIRRIGVDKSKKIQPAVGGKSKKVNFFEILRRKGSDQG